MGQIGVYRQVSDFTTENAGTAEWCKATRDGKTFFVKKLLTPVYPSKDLGLPEKIYNARATAFKRALAQKNDLYQRIRAWDKSRLLVVPLQVMNYQFHICTISNYVTSNVTPDQIRWLSEWQRLILMRTLTYALMCVHNAGVVHSDMKPENVLITQDPKGNCTLCLIDFDGSFLESNPPTHPEQIVGDPTFYSPEAYMQSMDENIRLDHRIDIFALGIIFHYFWCGKYPNTPADQTVGECLVRGGTVTLDDSLPLALKQLIKKMIAADPKDRVALKSVYDVLGAQVACYPAVVVNLQKTPAPTETRTGTAKVIVYYRDENDNLLRQKIVEIPYGTTQVIKAESVDGYYVTGRGAINVTVDSSGRTESPVTFKYQKSEPIRRFDWETSPDEVVATKKKREKKDQVYIWAMILILLFIILLYFRG